MFQYRARLVAEYKSKYSRYCLGSLSANESLIFIELKRETTMNPSLAIAIRRLQKEKEELENEVKKLKKTLQFRHTTINDLRY